MLESRRSGDTGENYVASPGREINRNYGEMNNPHARMNRREDQNGVITVQQTVSGDGTDEEDGGDTKSVESPVGKNLYCPIPRAPATSSARWALGTTAVVEPGATLRGHSYCRCWQFLTGVRWEEGGTSTSAAKHDRDRKRGRLDWKAWDRGELITGNETHSSRGNAQQPP